MELDFVSALSAITALNPDQECLAFRDLSLTRSQFLDRVVRLSQVLTAHDIGLRKNPADTPYSSHNDHVALYLLNGNEYLEGMLGAWAARAASFNVNYRYVANELLYLLNNAETAAIIVHERFTPALVDVLAQLETKPRLILVVADGSGHGLLDGALDYETALSQMTGFNALENEYRGHPDDLYLCYTGGTTGMPKGTMWRQADFMVAALGIRRRDGSEYDSLDELAAAVRGTVRALPAAPLMHGAAHWNALSSLLAGGAVVIQNNVESFDPVDILQTVERHRASSLLLVGDPMARPLLDHLEPNLESYDLSSLRHVLSGGAVLSPATKNRLIDAVPHLTVVDVLGSTESGRQGVAHTKPGQTGSSTFAPSPTSVVLSEDLTQVLPRDNHEIGWLGQGGRVPIGYLNDEAASRKTFPVIDGVRYSVPGDRAHYGEDGSIVLLGRDSVCINSGGEKIFAEEVETAVKNHPAVDDAVVCGRPSERWGNEVTAIVSLKAGETLTLSGLTNSLDGELARYKFPRALVIVDKVVRAPSGKADYRWAKERALESLNVT